MHSAVVFVDGEEVGRHVGGYLPFEVDLTRIVTDDQPHQLLVRVDNRDNPDVPPGKPFDALDFCWHGGLYRDAELRGYPEIYITDPLAAGKPASGGLFIRTLTADKNRAVVCVQTHVANATKLDQAVRVSVEILREGSRAGAGETAAEIGAGQAAATTVDVAIAQPFLWAPDSPNLYIARVTVFSANGAVSDVREERFGVRVISFTRAEGFSINHRRVRLRGVNRHQEYPYVGYAVPRRRSGGTRVESRRRGLIMFGSRIIRSLPRFWTHATSSELL